MENSFGGFALVHIDEFKAMDQSRQMAEFREVLSSIDKLQKVNDTQQVRLFVDNDSTASFDGKDLIITELYSYSRRDIKLSPLAQWQLSSLLARVALNRSRLSPFVTAEPMLDDGDLVRFLKSQKEEQGKTIDDLRSLAAEMNAMLSTIRFNEPYRISSTVSAEVDVYLHVKLICGHDSISLFDDGQKRLLDILNVVAPVERPEEEVESNIEPKAEENKSLWRKIFG